jgi:hypothetical protein
MKGCHVTIAEMIHGRTMIAGDEIDHEGTEAALKSATGL